VAMLCKTSMIMFPFIILLYIWWKRGRIGMKAVQVSVPFFVISFGLGLVTIWFLHLHAIGQNPIDLGGLFSRLALAGTSIAFYFTTCFGPIGLSPIYPKWTIDPPSLIQFLPWPILAGMIYWFWTKKTDWGRHALLGLGFFLINLLPFIGFTPASYMGFSWVMDHILYISLIGPIGLVIAGMEQMEGQFPSVIRPVGIGMVTMTMAFLAWESHRYAGMFVNNITLWSYVLERNPDAWLAHNDLGFALEQAGRIEEAIQHDKQAIAMRPYYADAHQNLGKAYLSAGRWEEAIAEDEEVIKVDPHRTGIRGNLGIALLRVNRLQEAIEQFQTEVKLDPENIITHNNLAIALIQANRFPEVVEQLQQSLRLDPGNASAHSNLGFALGKAGRIPEAIEQYEIALKINPNDTDAQNQLTQLQARQPIAPKTSSSGK